MEHRLAIDFVGLANIRVGFTGTRDGMTDAQREILRKRLDHPATTWTMFSEFHHGDCVGADAQAHGIMGELIEKNWPKMVKRVVHPPKHNTWRARCDGGKVGGVEIREPKSYFARDLDIVTESDVLIATPKTFHEVQRSGTWLTVRMARSRRRPILIIWPDGAITPEGFDLSKGAVR